MEPETLLRMGNLLLLLGAVISIIFYATTFAVRHWKELRSVTPIWRNKFPSFEEYHALFDRGDIMVSAIFIASTLQLSHPALSKVIKAHSTYRTDPWRRTVRTVAFIYIMIRSKSSERQQVIAWLQKLHGSIPLFVFETNLLVFATFAYGLVMSHQVLGNLTSVQADGIVSGVLSMADKLDPKDVGRPVPQTMVELEQYLQRELSFHADELAEIYTELCDLTSVRRGLKERGLGSFLTRPLASARLLLFQGLVRKLSSQVLASQDESQIISDQLFWWCLRKVHCFLSYFHYSVCPYSLTFEGTLRLLVAGVPRMENVVMELYCEIFGTKGSALMTSLPEVALRRFSDMEAHLPRMEIDQRPIPKVPSFCEEAKELIKCSYYRGKLAEIKGQPRHLGVIMDGNRRYSRQSGLDSVLAGHQVGAHKLIQVMSWAFSSGVQNLTVWALSDDNLKRGPQELNPLFSMMAEYLDEMMVGNAPFSIPDIRFRVVGDRSILPDFLNDMITKAEVTTANNTRFNFQIAIGYGGRSEVVLAAKLAVRTRMSEAEMSAAEAVEGMTEADITRQTYSGRLGLPPIDGILRTSGENRLSGFALWESHHAEFAIVEENWPALRQSTLLRSLLSLSKRNRRFGA